MTSQQTHLAVGITAPFTPLTSFSRPTPSPNSRQLLVKTLAVGFTPLSQWQVDFGLLVPEDGLVLGGNLVAEVLQVGSALEKEVKVGDKIFSFQFASQDGRPFQEIVLIEENTFAVIPSNLTIEEAATIPDSFVTAYHTLQTELGVPLPLELPPTSPPADPSLSILVWGGGSSCGLFAVQILKAAGYTNVSATASPSRFPMLKTLGGDSLKLYDYHHPLPDSVQPSIVFDCVGDEEHTVRPISKLNLAAKAKIAILLPVRKGGYGSTEGVAMETAVPFAEDVEVIGVRTHYWERNETLKPILQRKIMHDVFASGIIKPTPSRIIEGSSFLEKSEKALSEVRNGTVRGEKLVIKL